MKKGRIFRTIIRDYTLHILMVIGFAIVVAGIMFMPLKHSSYASSQAVTTSTGNWTTYMWNNERSGYNSTETIINPITASHLKIHWQHVAGGFNQYPTGGGQWRDLLGG